MTDDRTPSYPGADDPGADDLDVRASEHLDRLLAGEDPTSTPAVARRATEMGAAREALRSDADAPPADTMQHLVRAALDASAPETTAAEAGAPETGALQTAAPDAGSAEVVTLASRRWQRLGAVAAAVVVLAAGAGFLLNRPGAVTSQDAAMEATEATPPAPEAARPEAARPEAAPSTVATDSGDEKPADDGADDGAGIGESEAGGSPGAPVSSTTALPEAGVTGSPSSESDLSESAASPWTRLGERVRASVGGLGGSASGSGGE